MVEIEARQMANLFVMSFSIIIFTIVSLGQRKELKKYLPALISMWVVNFATNIEAFIAPDAFNFMEHFCTFLAAGLFFGAICLDYYQRIIKSDQNDPIIKQP